MSLLLGHGRPIKEIPAIRQFRRKSPGTRSSRKTSASSMRIIACQDSASLNQFDNRRSISSSSLPKSATVNDSNGRWLFFAMHSDCVTLRMFCLGYLEPTNCKVFPVPGSPGQVLVFVLI